MDRQTPAERFWKKVEVGTPDACWHWTANKNNKGYGLFRPGASAQKRLAHRISFAMSNGPIPDGLCVLHKCDMPSCVNPAHLFLGTMLENTQDMDRKGRRKTVISPLNKPPRLQGSKHPNSKLTEEEVIEIRKRLAAGDTLRGLARELSMDRKTLMSLRDRKSWRHI